MMMLFNLKDLFALVSYAFLEGRMLSTKTGLPFWPATFATLLILLFIYIISKFNTTMTETKIQRTVHGDPTNPSSTRDLSGVSPREMEHLKLCLIGAIREAEAFQVMGDDEMLLLLENAQSVSEQYGFPGFDMENADPDSLRVYFAERHENQIGLLTKLPAVDEAPEMTIAGITPKEYEHLVTTVQAGLCEAILYSTFSQGQIQMGVDAVNRMYVAWGLEVWDHYDKWSERWPEFFAGREKILSTVLEAVNQPYPGYAFDPFPEYSSEQVIAKLVDQK